MAVMILPTITAVTPVYDAMDASALGFSINGADVDSDVVSAELTFKDSANMPLRDQRRLVS